jgi:ATP-binding cassette subfamily D (ALD) protein 3
MTQDISKFSDALSNLWSNVSKPILDMALFSRELATLVGWEGPISIGIWYLLSGIVIKLISPAFSRLTVVEQELEGEYRACQSDLINYSEEITFYRGD